MKIIPIAIMLTMWPLCAATTTPQPPSAWVQLKNLEMKAVTYPECSKNNRNTVICTFTGELANGQFRNAKMESKQGECTFVQAWFKQVVGSITVSGRQPSLSGTFQLRFQPVSNVLAAPPNAAAAITLWYASPS